MCGNTAKPSCQAKVQCHDRLCIDYLGSGVPHAKFHRDDCCGLETTIVGIITDWRMASFALFTLFKCLTAYECFINILCLKSSIGIHGFYAFVCKKQHHQMLYHAPTSSASAILINSLWADLWHVLHLSLIRHTSHLLLRCAQYISNITHKPLTTACSLDMQASFLYAHHMYFH